MEHLKQIQRHSKFKIYITLKILKHTIRMLSIIKYNKSEKQRRKLEIKRHKTGMKLDCPVKENCSRIENGGKICPFVTFNSRKSAIRESFAVDLVHRCREEKCINGERRIRRDSVGRDPASEERFPLGNENGRRFVALSISRKNDEGVDLCLVAVRCTLVPKFP